MVRKHGSDVERQEKKSEAGAGDSTHNEGMVELGAQETLLPIVTNDTPDSLRNALLDGATEPRTIIDKFAVIQGMIARGRWIAAGRTAGNRRHVDT